MPNIVLAAATGLPKPRRRAKPLLRLSLPIPPGAGPRTVVETEIQRLIDLLDWIDPDPDLEPWLAGAQTSRALDAEDNCEDEGAQCDDEGHDSDAELSMGWTEIQEGAQPSGPCCLPHEEENAVFPDIHRSLADEHAATAVTLKRFEAVIARLAGARSRSAVRT